jgi:hypothetical protein
VAAEQLRQPVGVDPVAVIPRRDQVHAAPGLGPRPPLGELLLAVQLQRLERASVQINRAGAARALRDTQLGSPVDAGQPLANGQTRQVE